MQDVMATTIDAARHSLWRWASFAEQYWWRCPQRPEVGCFGTGSNDWGVQTNQKYLGAMAVLATDGHEGDCHGFSPDRAAARALSALRYSLVTHVTGDMRRTDGTQWGRTWISGLGIERMMHGVDRLAPLLTDEDRADLKRVLADEADWLCTNYGRGGGQGVRAGLWSKDGGNDPESNLWNGAICARAALYWPDDPRVPQWTERAHLFFMNGISVGGDAGDESIVAGRRVKDWHVGANFFSHYALDHHSYLNVGYMVICLSNIAMLHYAFAQRGKEAPETLYHHARDLWGLVRRLFCSDGRLLRMGGDSRIRYCYCQDYVIPTLIFAADYWSDSHALNLLKGAVALITREQAFSEDGRFLCSRLDPMPRVGPHYFCRLESDRAAVLSQAMDWLSRCAIDPPAPQADYESSVAGSWEEPEHGALFHRSATRFASWSWRAYEAPQGLCLPPSDGDVAEWQENLSGRVHGLGRDIARELVQQSQATFPGGFLTVGAFLDRSAPAIAEGWHDESTAYHQVAFAALPDDHTVVRLEHATLAAPRSYLGGWEGVKLEIPNDVFNGMQREYRCAGGVTVVEGHVGEPRVVDLESMWACVGDAVGLVGIYGDTTWRVLQRGRRIGGTAMGNVLTDTFCFQLRTQPCDMDGPAVVLDNGCLIMASVDATGTQAVAERGEVRREPCTVDLAGEGASASVTCRAVRVTGRDGVEYILLANFSRDPVHVRLPECEGPWRDLATGVAFPALVTTGCDLEPCHAYLLSHVRGDPPR